MLSLIGRSKEIAQLSKLIAQPQPNFIAVYGRRRIGKTMLIRQVFGEHTTCLEVTGIKDGNTTAQLAQFSHHFAALEEGRPPFVNWMDAFHALTEWVKHRADAKPFTLFLDELPWLASPRSGLLQALDVFWNTQWSQLPKFNLVVCGSAASWMLNKIINSKGGLHNRITYRLHLMPFTLQEAEALLRAKGCRFSHKQIADLYMVTGGVPFYLDAIVKNASVAQNINRLCFQEGGLLRDEFDRLFDALFNYSDNHMRIIRAIAKRRYGMSRNACLAETKLTSGGFFNERLYELEASGFITRYVPLGKKAKDAHYRVTDEYALFYLRWIEPTRHTGFTPRQDYWQTKVNAPEWLSWAGYAFEGVCMKHVDQLAKALGLARVGYQAHTWRAPVGSEQGAQIDLLLDRDDDAITVVEIKYSRKAFILDKHVAMNLTQKLSVFQHVTKTQKQLLLAMITPAGVKKNVWCEELLDASVGLEALFNSA